MSVKVEEIRNLNDPQRVYKWRVILPLIGDFLSDFLTKKVNTESSKLLEALGDRNSRQRSIARQASGIIEKRELTSQGLSTFGFNPSLHVEDVQGVPLPGVNREEFYEGGRNTYFPSIEDTGVVTITFYVDQSDKVFNYLHDWKRLITNEDGTKNLPPEYKKPIRIQHLDGSNRAVFDLRLIGCFPTNTTPYSLSQEAGRLSLTQEFSVDRVEILPANFESLGKSLVEDKLQSTSKEIIENRSKFFNS